MDDIAAAEEVSPDLVHDVLLRLFGRRPRERLVERWAQRIEAGASAREFLEEVAASDLYQANAQVVTHRPAGHFFSPVVDPEQVGDYYEMSMATGLEELRASGIAINIGAMRAFWQRHREFIAASPWTGPEREGYRFHYDGGPYGRGDANSLRAVFREFRPRRVIEIGSGYSSAAMLDVADELALEPFRLTCIEPYADRLRSRLRPEDRERVEIIEQGVQAVDPAMFDELDEGDVCFIDSTHVLKTGSDVHFELFHILPRLKAGVLVHFHDCRFPFEYTPIQVFEKNYSWNEIYAVRALLMFSRRFRIFFWPSLFEREHPELVAGTLPDFSVNPGSAIWLRVLGQEGRP